MNWKNWKEFVEDLKMINSFDWNNTRLKWGGKK